MRSESNKFLSWPGCDNHRKIILNNELAKMQNRGVYSPRLMDRNVLNAVGILERVDNMLMTRVVYHGENFDIPIWRRAFSIQEESFREWCLEFYSSIKIDDEVMANEIATKKCISFRLGGRDRTVSVPEFGLLAGLLTEQEVNNRGAMKLYMESCELNSTGFGEDSEDHWYLISGKRPHSSSSSKISDCRVPILRVLNKMISYSFLQRSTHQDKVYVDDLWLLCKFHENDPTKFVNVPWVLANFMESKAAGKQRDSQICCGNFVTRIAVNLGVYNQTQVRACSPGVQWRMITLRDLETSGLISAGRLIRGGAAPAPVPAGRERRRAGETSSSRASRGGTTVRDEVQQLGRHMGHLAWDMGQMSRQVSSMAESYEYHVQRFGPYLDHMSIQAAQVSGDDMGPYHPPALYYPQQYQQDDDEETEQDDDE